MGAGHSSRHREKAQGEAQETGTALGTGTGQEAEICPRTRLWDAGTDPGQGLRDRDKAWDVAWDPGTGQEVETSAGMRLRTQWQAPGQGLGHRDEAWVAGMRAGTELSRQGRTGVDTLHWHVPPHWSAARTGQSSTASFTQTPSLPQWPRGGHTSAAPFTGVITTRGLFGSDLIRFFCTELRGLSRTAPCSHLGASRGAL